MSYLVKKKITPNNLLSNFPENAATNAVPRCVTAGQCGLGDWRKASVGWVEQSSERTAFETEFFSSKLGFLIAANLYFSPSGGGRYIENTVTQSPKFL